MKLTKMIYAADKMDFMSGKKSARVSDRGFVMGVPVAYITWKYPVLYHGLTFS